MNVAGKDLLSQVEQEHPKLGILLRSYIIPSIESRGLPNHILATPTDKVGNAKLTPISSLSTVAGVSQIVAGTDVTISPPSGTGVVTINSSGAAGVTQIIAGTGITISPPTGVGVVTINSSGSGGGVFVDNETVSGSGTSWTLVLTPTPPGSLFLVQMLPAFGSIVLVAGTDYTLSGGTITTTNSLTAGVLRAWYRAAPLPGTNFADDETVAGAGTAWTLTHSPSPSGSLILVQELPGFGGVVLIVGTDYTIAGAAITTTNSLTAGVLTAWYRY